MGYKETYERNREKLERYVWWRRGKLAEYNEIKVRAELYPEGYINNESKPVKIERTNINTRPFFRDLTKPLLIKNEFNGYNIEYVVDNVRRSEDYGGDNHVYFYYESFDEFLLLLQVEDITPYLKDNKVIFLFEEEIEDYPIDFKKEYGIDYSKNPPKPIRLEEINRIFLHLGGPGPVGFQIWSGIFDFHKNLLTIKSFGLYGITYLYEKLLKNKTVDEVYEALMDNENKSIYCELSALFDPWNHSHRVNAPAPSVDKFFEELGKIFPKDYKPAKEEWYKGMFLAYSLSFGRKLNQRIAPAIIYHSHRVNNINSDMKDNFDLFDKFKYLRIITSIRRPTACIASQAELCTGTWFFQDVNYFYYVWEILDHYLRPKSNGEGDYGPYHLEPGNKYFPYTRIIRFEDLKLEPKATLEAVLDFYDFEWDDSLLKTTSNGISENSVSNTGKKIKDFDPAPVFRSKERFFSPFDLYRLEIIFTDIYKPFDYKPEYFDGKKYSKNEIIELFNQPFKCENFLYTPQQINYSQNSRQELLTAVKEFLNRPLNQNQYGQKISPIPWLKPKKKFLKNNLYE